MKLWPRLLLTASTLLALLAGSPARAAEPELSGAEFLARARQSRGTSSYARLEGTVRHQRRGEARLEYPIYFGILILPERMAGQLLLNEREGYVLGQTFHTGDGETSVVPQQPGGYADPLLGKLGMRASDLTTGFLFYRFLRELPEETVRLVPCRVLELESPDGKETVRVYLAREYLFPLKTEFFRKEEPDRAYRTLEVASFKKQNDLYYVDTLDLSGPGWRTRINFDRAEVGVPPAGTPPNVFREPVKEEVKP